MDFNLVVTVVDEEGEEALADTLEVPIFNALCHRLADLTIETEGLTFYVEDVAAGEGSDA